MIRDIFDYFNGNQDTEDVQEVAKKKDITPNLVEDEYQNFDGDDFENADGDFENADGDEFYDADGDYEDADGDFENADGDFSEARGKRKLSPKKRNAIIKRKRKPVVKPKVINKRKPIRVRKPMQVRKPIIPVNTKNTRIVTLGNNQTNRFNTRVINALNSDNFFNMNGEPIPSVEFSI